MKLDDVLEYFRSGMPIMIHDSSDREDEVDLVFYAGAVDSDSIYTLRTRAGGLICYATVEEVVKVLGLRFMDEVLTRLGDVYAVVSQKLPRYGDRPAFVLWVNHVETKTGISDDDRALTIRKLHEVSVLALKGEEEKARELFMAEFQSPGHVPLLAARRIEERRGHTELSVALARLAGLEPSVAFAEMLSRGGRLTVREAQRLSEKLGWPLVEGNIIVEACKDEGLCGGH